MYENKKEPLASKSIFYRRLWKNFFIALIFIAACLGIGIVGYKMAVPEFSWYDAILNAAMILSGMGPVMDTHVQLSNSAKLFASFYALFSGVAFISTIGLIVAPIAHRFFHKLNMEE